MSENSNQKDLARGNIVMQLWQQAWPMMLSMFFYTLYSIVDTFWVGKISSDAIAAVSISQVALFVMISIGMGISIGSSVIMGMHIGAKEKSKAEKVLGQSFVLMTIMALFFTMFSLIFRQDFLEGAGAVGSIYEPALIYFTITAAGSFLFFYLINIMFAFNSEGDTFMLTKLFALSTIMNLILDPVLIFGKFGFPELGIAGAAYATLISQLVFVLLGLWVLSRPNRGTQFLPKNLVFNWESVKTVLSIGAPAALTQVVNPLATAVLIYIVASEFLEPGATAFSLVFRLEFFAYVPAISFGMAAMAMIGQSLGAGEHQRAVEIFKKSTLIGFASAFVFGLLLIVFGKNIIGIFTTDQIVTDYSYLYLLIVAGTYGFLAVGMIVASIFQAMGQSWPGFWLFFVKYFVIAIPFSYLFGVFYSLDIWMIWAVIGDRKSVV